jgi:hypothetical protein
MRAGNEKNHSGKKQYKFDSFHISSELPIPQSLQKSHPASPPPIKKRIMVTLERMTIDYQAFMLFRVDYCDKLSNLLDAIRVLNLAARDSQCGF